MSSGFAHITIPIFPAFSFWTVSCKKNTFHYACLLFKYQLRFGNGVVYNVTNKIVLNQQKVGINGDVIYLFITKINLSTINIHPSTL